jgi:hypothetical protein
LQNSLNRRLPTDFIEELSSGVALSYSIIPQIAALPEPLRTQVREAFADGLKLIWQTMIGISGLGLLSVLLMEEVDMKASVDSRWALESKEKEKGTEGPPVVSVV